MSEIDLPGTTAPAAEAPTAAQRWRERLGATDQPLPAGTAAQYWRERLAAECAPATPVRRPPRSALSWLTLPLALPALALLAVPATAVATRQPAAEAEGQATRRPAGLGARSATMEACRVLRLNLLAGTGRAAPPPLVMIAPAPERTCGLVAAGLAIALAEEGCRTLLVDADLRAPLLHALFGLELSPGLAAVLAGGDSAQAGVDVLPNLRLLAAGMPAPGVTLGSQPALARVTAELAQQYDTVIYHIAARRSSADALQLASRVGAAVFCLRAGVDASAPVRRMRDTLERAGAQALGFALIGEDES